MNFFTGGPKIQIYVDVKYLLVGLLTTKIFLSVKLSFVMVHGCHSLLKILRGHRQTLFYF